MNQLKKCTAIKSVLLLAAFCTATVVQASDVAAVTHLSGPLLAQKANGSVRALASKSAVEAGDTLSTQNKSYAQIKFSDGSTLILQPDTVVRIDQFSYDAAQPSADSAAFTLVQGAVRANAGLLGKRSKEGVQIVTPAATISMQAANVVVRYVAPSGQELAAARQTYLLASTAMLEVALSESRSDMPAPVAIQPLMLAQTTIPTPTGLTQAGLPPGLYTQVISGLIQVSNPAGAQNFTAGQFGFTPNPRQQPVMLPNNPGLSFKPPIAFNAPPSSSGSATGTPQKTNTVDCEVR